MKTKNKKVVNLLGVVLLTIFSVSNVLAQNDEAGSKDNPLISRFPGSSIMTYDLKQFNNYLLVMGKMSADTVEKSQKLEGKVTQITYAAPKDRSILEIFRNYETFLKSNGFVILFSSNKSELGSGWLGKFLAATPRAYRYGAPALATRMEGDFNYLDAKMTRTQGDVFVALCVATSWYQDFPVIELDVIETIPISTGMMKVNAKAGTKEIQATDNTQSDQSILKSKNVKSFDLMIGFGGFSFSAPWLSGSSNMFTYNPSGTVTGSITGFGLLKGPYVNARYFFNENFGISLDFNSLTSEESIFTSNKNYTSSANLFAQKIGLTGQIVGNNTPIRISSTLGAGNCITELDQQIVNIPSSTADIFLKGKESMFVMFVNVDITFPVYKKLYLFGNYEFNFMPVGDFVMDQDGGNDYSYTYYNSDFGGSHFRFGLGYSF